MNEPRPQDDFDSEDERYTEYAEEFDPDYRADAHRHRRPPVAKFVPKVPWNERYWYQIEEEKRRSIRGEWDTTYQPGHSERRWLMGLLRPFFETQAVDDVLSLVKGGKEADVYRCSLTEKGIRSIFAAKVYRPRSHRTLGNDQIYREGRQILGQSGFSKNGQGRLSKAYDRRVLRAMLKRTDYGKQAHQTSWLMYEYNTLVELCAAGGDVPEPIEVAPSAILMEFIGDEQVAAPTLHDVRLEPAEVKPLFDRVVHNLELMLAAGFIHGDLSAHNILYWQGKVVIIDFPQVVPVVGNKQAYALLERDVLRICQYWRKQGLSTDPEALTRSLWGTYSTVRHADIMADLSAALAPDPEDDDLWEDEDDEEY